MITMFVILNFILFIGLAYKFYQMSQIVKTLNLPKVPKLNDIILTKPKNMPSFDVVDPNNQLLKDVIETAKLENWQAKVEESPSMDSIQYTITILNPAKTLSILSIIRVHFGNDTPPKLIVFNITQGKGFEGVSFGGSESNTEEYYLCIEFIWSLILNDNENDYKDAIVSYSQIKKSIEKELTSLRRNKQLNTILP